MNNNKGNNQESDKTGDIMSWVIIIILMFVLPPLGWVLLFIKLGFFASKKSKNKIEQSQNIIPTKKIKRSRLDKKTGKGMSVLLLLVAIGFAVTGIGTLSNWISGGLTSIPELIFGSSYILGALVAFLSRNVVSHQYARYKNYYAYMEDRGVIPIYELMQISGLSAKKVKVDLQKMINNGYLTPGAYIDNNLECLVLSSGDAHKLRMEIMGTQPIQNSPTTAENTKAPGNTPATQDTATLAELREASSFIKDEVILTKVQRLIELTDKIFAITTEAPEKQPQLRRFSSYYLPTTLKLVRSYTTLEKQGVKGENITTTKNNIGDILDTLITGFEQQLDQLFKSEAIDIATDINVLENLMQQDGLASDKSEFQVTASGTF